MKDINDLVKAWFNAWDSGDIARLPIADHFKHTSPYGTIHSKKHYLDLIAANRDKFLGNKIIIHDQLSSENRSCVRYTVSKGDFSMEVSEWIYAKGDLIEEIFSYYNIEGETSDARKLENM